MQLTLLKTLRGYDFYIGDDNGKKVYNIVPTGSDAPVGGYYAKEYICQVKGFSVSAFD
mgnify:FL=1